MAENLYAMRCTEFFGVRRINIRRSDKKFETSKRAQLNAKEVSIAEEGMGSRANFFRKMRRYFIWHVQQS